MKKHILFCFGFLSSLVCFSQASIEGLVNDSKTSHPLAFANISIENSNLGTVTDEKGFFYISIENQHEDTYVIFSMIGYSTKKIKISELKGHSQNKISLELTEYVLPGITVTSTSGDKIVKNALKRLPTNYNTSTFNMLAYFTHKQLINGTVVKKMDAVVDIHDLGFDKEREQQKFQSLKSRESKYESEKAYKNWMDNAGYGFLTLLLENNYVKNKNSILHKSNKYQVDSTYKTTQNEIYAISTYNKPYYLTGDPTKTVFTAQVFLTSDDYKIVRILENEKVRDENDLKSIQWKKQSAQDIVSAIVSQKQIIEYKEWKGKLYISNVYNEFQINDYKQSTGAILNKNKYISTLTVNEIYLGETSTQRQEEYIKSYWDGYIIKRGVNSPSLH